MSADRYDRQRRLSEVGATGHERIVASVARIVAGSSASTTLAYLVRAGVERGEIERARAPREPFALAPHFLFSGPARVAAGAHAALLHLSRVIEER